MVKQKEGIFRKGIYEKKYYNNCNFIDNECGNDDRVFKEWTAGCGKYAGTISEIAPFVGEVLSVEKQ